MDADYHTIDHEKFQKVDFSAPVMSTQLHLIAVKEFRFGGKIFEGTFDTISIILISLYLCLFSILLWIFEKQYVQNVQSQVFCLTFIGLHF